MNHRDKAQTSGLTMGADWEFTGSRQTESIRELVTKHRGSAEQVCSFQQYYCSIRAVALDPKEREIST